jgi:dipeptidyl aminopeptidase/acylaminoacyl peptidase
MSSSKRSTLVAASAIAVLALLCLLGALSVRFLSIVLPVTLLPSDPATGRPLGAGDAIAFSVMRLDMLRPFQLYVLDDDRGIRSLTRGVRTGDTAPLWSPDGARIVYASISGAVTHHVLIDADGGDPRPITPDDAYQGLLRWSPDGSRLAYLAYPPNPDGSPSSSPYLCVIELATGETHRAPAGSIQDLAWMPDGASLLAIVRGDEGMTVEAYGADGVHQRRLSVADFLRDAGSIALSPGAGRVAYVSLGPGADGECPAESLVISALDGSATWPVGPLAVAGPIAWSPDGARIAFIALTGDYDYALYVAGADGAGLRELMVLNPGDESGEMLPAAPAWSPDGARLAIGSVSEPDHAAIWVMNAGGTDRREVVTVAGTGAMIYDLAWRPRP